MANCWMPRKWMVFDLVITTDQNLKHEQNLTTRTVAIVVLLSTSWPKIRNSVDAIVETVGRVRPGEYVEVAI